MMTMEAKKWIGSQDVKSRASTPSPSLGGKNGISLDTIRSIEWLHANAVLISYDTDAGLKILEINADAASLKWLVDALTQRLIGISLDPR